MADEIRVGERVQVFLNEKDWGQGDWFSGTVVRIEPYSAHRSFYWVQLDQEAAAALGGGVQLISVLEPEEHPQGGGLQGGIRHGRGRFAGCAHSLGGR
jgi:hypothetical protein